jgi:hypothetical protein
MILRPLLAAVAVTLVAVLVAGCAPGSPASPQVSPISGGGSRHPETPDASISADGAPSTPTADAGPEGSSLPCDVDTVLAGHCRGCHGAVPAFGAPMALVTYANLWAPAASDPSKHVYELVDTRVHDDAKPMPQPPNPRLGAQDLATLDAWVTAGAPPGGSCDGGAVTSVDAAPPALSCAPDTHIAPASPWSMPASTSETYVCYGFDVNVSAKRHITAFAPHLDDASLLHHIVLLEADASVSPVPAECDLGGAATWRPIFGWAPGGQSFELPQEAGFPEDTTTHFVVQLHYVNLHNASGLTDGSGFDLCTTAQLRPNDADVMAFGTVNVAIPPHASVTDTCDVQVPSWGASTHLFAAFPHMHELGTSISTTALPLSGTPSVDLGTLPQWNFGEQGWIPISYLLQPGDTVQTVCSWTNTTDQEVTFGESSANEMCYSFTMYYPKITNPEWSWSLPALYSVCH